MSLSIRIVTSVVLVMTAGFCIAGFSQPPLALAGGVVALIGLLCYLFAPVGYDVADGALTVRFHLGQKRYGRIVRCSRVTERPFALRLFGNGGCFAGAGIYWNRSMGVHHAYVTSARLTDLVLVETIGRRIVISPEDPDRFIALCPARG